jgi:hypothetical protein
MALYHGKHLDHIYGPDPCNTLFSSYDGWLDWVVDHLIDDVILEADLQDARIIRKLPDRDARFMTSFPLLSPS